MKHTALSRACMALMASLPALAFAQYQSSVDSQGSYAVSTPTASGSGFEVAGVPASGEYDPKSIRLGTGAIAVTPTMGIGMGYNSNMARVATNQKSSSFLLLSPALLATAEYGISRYSLGYKADMIRYQSSSTDNIDNQELAASGLHDLDARFAVNWRASLQDRFDPIGSTDRIATGNSPDHWQATNWALAGRYGATSAKGRLFFEVGQFDKEYKNNLTSTRASNYKSDNAMLRFMALIAPKTSLIAELRHTSFDYELNASNLDNTERRALVGLEWEATAATSGTIKVGQMTKKYDAVRAKFSGATWEGGVRWAPLTYSRVDFSLGRTASDPTGGVATYLVSNYKSVTWTHDWRSYFSTRVGFGRNNTDYVGSGRRDKIEDISLGADYVLTRNAKLSADVQASNRNSNNNTFDYDLNLVTMKVDLAF